MTDSYKARHEDALAEVERLRAALEGIRANAQRLSDNYPPTVNGIGAQFQELVTLARRACPMKDEVE